MPQQMDSVSVRVVTRVTHVTHQLPLVFVALAPTPPAVKSLQVHIDPHVSVYVYIHIRAHICVCTHTARLGGAGCHVRHLCYKMCHHLFQCSCVSAAWVPTL